MAQITNKNESGAAAAASSATIVASIVAPTTLICGQRTCAAAATAEALAASTPLRLGVTVQALAANTGTVHIRAAAAGANGVVLYAGDSVFIPISNLVLVFVKVSVNAEGVGYVAS